MDEMKILILEDSREDVDLVLRELKKGGMAFTSMVVSKKQDYIRALEEFRPDVILSDHSLPQFNSIEAMSLYKEYQDRHKVTIPFILITGSVSEEFAVQCIKSGADDYILKDRLVRLPSSIQSAIEKNRIENERVNFMSEIISNETLMKEAEFLAHFGSWQVDLDTGVHKWSDEAFRIFGYEVGEVTPDYENFFRHVHPDDAGMLKGVMEKVTESFPTQECEYRIVDKKNQVRDVLSKIAVKRESNGAGYSLVGFTLDITRQKRQTMALEMQNQRLREIAWVQSHQVRAPLARIMGLVQLINDYPDQKNDLPGVLNQIIISANELDDMIRKIVRKTEEIG